MKILVVGVARSATHALTKHLEILNAPIVNHREYFFNNLLHRYNDLAIAGKRRQQIINNEVGRLYQELCDKEPNFIIKIIPGQLGGISNFLDILPWKDFDQICLIERKSFWDQCCSRYVAAEESFWLDHERIKTYTPATRIKNKKYKIDKKIISWTAHDVFKYIEFKKFLIQSNIKFVQYHYEDELFQGPQIGEYIKNRYDYSQMIVNYTLGSQVMDIFNRCFDYENLRSDLDEFIFELDKINF